MNKKGFTLIELLAVIIILGILMIIAIPSVTNYINDSRKSAYVDTAKEIISGARNLVNDGKLGMYDTGTTYYIPAKYVNTENSLKSPYGDFTDESAYVGVIYDGKGYKYYWISSDDTGQGIPEVTPVDKLETDDIKSDLKIEDIRTTIENTGIGNRKTIKILKPNGTWENQIILSNTNNNIPEEGANSSGETNTIVYPAGKTKETVVTGDLVTIRTEEFYVVKHDGDDLILLAKYNLKVGNIIENYIKTREYTNNDEGYGRQSSDAIGYISGSSSRNATVAFSYSNYWNGKVGTNYPGGFCNRNTSATCGYVYDSNSYLKEYVDNYKTFLEGKGITIKNARLLRFEEAYELGCDINALSCANAPSWLYQTTFWLGSAYNNYGINAVYSDKYFYRGINDVYDYYGVRPVIVI